MIAALKTSSHSFGRLRIRAAFLVILFCMGACGQKLDPETYLQRAKEHIAAARYAEGIIELKNALQGDADLAEARWLLGDLYLKTGDGAAAQKELERAKELGYIAPDMELAILRSMLLQEDYTEVLLRVPDVDDDNATADLLSIRGEARLGQGKPDEAVKAFAKALELDPDSINALLGSARLAIGAGAFDEGAAHLDHLERIARKVLLERPLVDPDRALARPQIHARYRRFPLSGRDRQRSHSDESDRLPCP